MGPLLRHSLAFGLAAALAACGAPTGSGGTSGIPATGVFIDSPVEGMSYVSGGHSGVTLPGGLFTYELGASVTFSVGEIVIGTGPGAALMSPVSLVARADDENDVWVNNIARFLLTLDDDADPDNGILISALMRQSATGVVVNFNQSAIDFVANSALAVAALTSVSSAGDRTLVFETVARAHLRDTLLASMAGNYEGTYTGDEHGTWEVDIALDGGVTGTGVADGLGTPFAFLGTVETDRTAEFSAPGGMTFLGTVGAAGRLIGTWSRPSGETGDFNGARTAG